MSQLGITTLTRWLGLGRPDRVGVDIEPTSVIMLALISVGNKFKLDKFNCKELPANCFIKDYINDPAVLGRVIRDIVRESILFGNRSVIAAPSKLVTMQEISIKHEIDPEQQEAMVWSEAKKVFPEIYHRLYLDYILRPKKSDSVEIKKEKIKESVAKEEKDDILLVAAHKQAMQARLEAMRLGGVEVDVIDVDYYALERCYQLIKDQLPQAHRNENVALLNIDTSSILLAVFNKEEQIHTYHHTYNIAQLENVVSLQLRKLMEIMPVQNGSTQPTAVLSQVQQDQLVNQIRYVLNTFSAQVGGANIDRVVLSGRCSLIPDFEKLLESKLGLKINDANPFSDMRFSMAINQDIVNRLAPACMLACGLAIRNCDNDKN